HAPLDTGVRRYDGVCWFGDKQPRTRHPGGSRGPWQQALSKRLWIPAFAGMTEFGFLFWRTGGSSAVASAEGLRHPGGSRGPWQQAPSMRPWIPAFAGMTEFVGSGIRSHERVTPAEAGVQGNKHRACAPGYRLSPVSRSSVFCLGKPAAQTRVTPAEAGV